MDVSASRWCSRSCPHVTVGAARYFGVVHGSLTVLTVLTVLVVLAVPSSRQVSRRLLLNLCLIFGWTPLLWWLPLPLGDRGRAGALLSVAVGGIGVWVGTGRSPCERARRILPRLALVDAYPLLAAALSAGVLYPWLQAKSGAAALRMLMKGWDHSAHFAMVRLIRHGGVSHVRFSAVRSHRWRSPSPLLRYLVWPRLT